LTLANLFRIFGNLGVEDAIVKKRLHCFKKMGFKFWILRLKISPIRFPSNA
jgi:hypothetical protein